MSDQTQQWTLVPESQCVGQDDYPGDDQIRWDTAGWEEEDAAWLRNECPARVTIFMEVAPGVLLDLDASGRVVGVEILDASQCLKPRRTEAA